MPAGLHSETGGAGSTPAVTLQWVRGSVVERRSMSR